eukprot:gene13634-28954_t
MMDCTGKTYPNLFMRLLHSISDFRENTIIDPYFIMLAIYIPICFGVYLNSNSSSHFDETPPTPLEYRYILVGEFTVSGLLLVEATLDAISNKSIFFSADGCLVNFSILMSLLISSSAIFFSTTTNNDRYFIFAVIDTRLALILGAVLSYSYHNGREIWRSRYLYASICFGGVGLILEISNALDGNTEISTVSMTLQAMLQWALTEIFDYKTVADCSQENLICVEVTITTFVVIQFLYQTRVLRKESNQQKEELAFKRMFWHSEVALSSFVVLQALYQTRVIRK